MYAYNTLGRPKTEVAKINLHKSSNTSLERETRKVSYHAKPENAVSAGEGYGIWGSRTTMGGTGEGGTTEKVILLEDRIADMELGRWRGKHAPVVKGRSVGQRRRRCASVATWQPACGMEGGGSERAPL